MKKTIRKIAISTVATAIMLTIQTNTVKAEQTKTSTSALIQELEEVLSESPSVDPEIAEEVDVMMEELNFTKKVEFIPKSVLTKQLPQKKYEFKMTIDGKETVFDKEFGEPYINSNDRTLVPVRFISENMGYKVSWDNATKIVSISEDIEGENPKQIHLKIGKNYAIKSDKSVVYLDTDANGKPTDTQAVITNDRTYVPLRFISEAMGAEIDYEQIDGDIITHIIDIKTQGTSKPRKPGIKGNAEPYMTEGITNIYDFYPLMEGAKEADKSLIKNEDIRYGNINIDNVNVYDVTDIYPFELLFHTYNRTYDIENITANQPEIKSNISREFKSYNRNEIRSRNPRYGTFRILYYELDNGVRIKADETVLTDEIYVNKADEIRQTVKDTSSRSLNQSVSEAMEHKMEKDVPKVEFKRIDPNQKDQKHADILGKRIVRVVYTNYMPNEVPSKTTKPDSVPHYKDELEPIILVLERSVMIPLLSDEMISLDLVTGDVILDNGVKGKVPKTQLLEKYKDFRDTSHVSDVNPTLNTKGIDFGH